MNSEGNHDRFPTLPDGKRDIVHSHSHIDTWKSMEKLLDTGKVKGIGVCNVRPSPWFQFLGLCIFCPTKLTQCPSFRIQYSKRYLEQLLASNPKVIPAVNQIENHPSLPQDEIVELCKEKGIHIMAYSPFGSTGGPLFTAEPVVKIAQKHNVSPSTILLSYHGASNPPLTLSLSLSPAKNICPVCLNPYRKMVRRSYQMGKC